jgi:hypothetical protein
MDLMHNFCLSKLRFDFFPFAIGFHDLSKVNEYDCHLEFCICN